MKLTATSRKILRIFTKVKLLVLVFAMHMTTYAGMPDSLTPVETSTLQNYPNPFNEKTTITYTIETYATVEIMVFNVLGSKIDVLEKKTKVPGTYNLEWNAQSVPEGIYIVQLKIDNQIITKKLIKH